MSDFPHTSSGVILLCRDLLLSSQVLVAARSMGVEVVHLRKADGLAGVGAARRLLVDLNLEGAIEAASAYKCRTGTACIGFVSHVDGQTISTARSAGIDRVMARSGFFSDLKTFLE